MTAIEEQADLSWHLRGNWAPVFDEVTATDLEVRGTIPVELDGHYLRAGMNPRSGQSDHWFFGNGMMHGVELGGGRALSYRNRYVRTPYYEQDMSLMEAMADPVNSPANTHVMRHAGRVLALAELYMPWEITTDLDTVGVADFGGKLHAPVTAHPKIDPVTNELIFFGYSMLSEPWLTYYRADASGNLVAAEPIDIPRPVMMHDFNITANHVIFMDLPLVFSLEKGFHWDPESGARLGVMPRTGGNADVRWYEVEPGYVFHPVNAYEDGDHIIIDVARFPEIMSQGMDDLAGQYPVLWRWDIDTSAGTVTECQRDDRYADFCRVDERRVGLEAQFGYLLQLRENPTTQEYGSEVYKYDLSAGDCVVHDLGTGVHGGEPVFVPRSPDADEDDGWVMLIAHDETVGKSKFVILDGQDFSAPPIAEVLLPQRVPYGPHGSWMSRQG